MSEQPRTSLIATVQSIVVTAGILVGGGWALYEFGVERAPRPSSSISAEVLSVTKFTYHLAEKRRENDFRTVVINLDLKNQGREPTTVSLVEDTNSRADHAVEKFAIRASRITTVFKKRAEVGGEAHRGGYFFKKYRMKNDPPKENGEPSKTKSPDNVKITDVEVPGDSEVRLCGIVSLPTGVWHISVRTKSGDSEWDTSTVVEIP